MPMQTSREKEKANAIDITPTEPAKTNPEPEKPKYGYCELENVSRENDECGDSCPFYRKKMCLGPKSEEPTVTVQKPYDVATCLAGLSYVFDVTPDACVMNVTCTDKNGKPVFCMKNVPLAGLPKNVIPVEFDFAKPKKK